MNKTLYVTSFNKKLFDATGKAMIQSFLSSKIEGDLLVTYEDDIAQEIPKADTISLLKLEDYEFLNHWLRENKDIIPIEYGGEMEGCGCKDIPSNKHYYKDHIKRCPNLGFNRRASLWFRKIAAMHKALSVSKDKGYERVVFIDSDVLFKKSITDEFLDKIFNSAGFFFHLGIHRKSMTDGMMDMYLEKYGKNTLRFHLKM